MKKIMMTAALLTTLSACSTQSQQDEMLIGGEKDQHGCLVSTGASYSFLKQACVQVFNIADVRLDNPSHEGSAVYAIFSEDRSKAEVFAVDLPENTILDAVKGGYVSQDGKIRLQKKKSGWKIVK